MTKSLIEWTDETWNPVTGCTKVSAGCKHCYAERAVWGECPVCHAADGKPCSPNAGIFVGEPECLTHEPLAHLGRLWAAPMRVRITAADD